MISLRHVAQRSSRRLSSSTLITKRSLATSRQKRALNEKQLGETKAAPSGDATPPPPTAASSSTTGSSSSSMPLIAAVVVAGGAFGAYYMDMIPGVSPTDPLPVSKKAAPSKKSEPAAKEAAPVQKEEKKEATSEPEPESTPEASGPAGNRVMNIALPEGTSRSAPPAPVTDHPTGGNRVSMEPAAPKDESKTQSVPSSVDKALKELQQQISKDDTARSLLEAHKDLALLASMDLSDLDELSMTQLKVRLVQLSKDMEERTKWEAVRLKEFLVMKEKEVEDKYTLILKKQRLEAESLMDQRMKEQKDTLTTQAAETLKEKEEALQSIIDNSLKIQEQHYMDEKANFEKLTEEKYNTKYEELYGTSLSKVKEDYTSKMEQKVQKLEALAKKVADLEFALQSSTAYKSGSVQAHRMSAAALALIDKLESSEPAGAAVAALQSVAESNPVVNAAIGALPNTVASSGVSTLQELQTTFEENVHPKCRQAAMIPEGQTGLEGQLMGMIFSSLRFAPGPDDAAPESQKDDAEYVLARARRHVQLGELEQAVEEMGKLKGQASFTANDWTTQAKARVAVEQALKVIRLECALANEVLAKDS
mmetsp:Transcript_29677/g.71445  ORF Transcript_29677/g.71445 Transcript_29677/m.71445 type:complete len:594 (-) Transcript_29677:50-1831(-)